jgi:hypothetical protein
MALAGAGVCVSVALGSRLGLPVGPPLAGVKASVTTGDAVFVGMMIFGVAVMIPGVRVGIGVQTGKGCGDTFHSSHPDNNVPSKTNSRIFLIGSLPHD